MARRAPREARGVRRVPVDDRMRGLSGVRAGEARHARRAGASGGRGGLRAMAQVELAGKWFDYADVLVDVQIGYACNVQCDYCSVTDEMRQENMLTAAVMDKLIEARARGAVKVAFGGGEPT